MTKKIYNIVLISSSGLLYGYDIGVLSGAISYIPYVKTIKQNENIVSFVVLGSIIGSFFAGKILKIFSKQNSILISLISIGCLLLIFIFNIKFYILGLLCRVFIGFFISLNTISCTNFVSQNVKEKENGFYVSLSEAGVTFGILLSYIFNWYFNKNWQLIIGVMIFFVLSGFLSLLKLLQLKITTLNATNSRQHINQENSIFPIKQFLIGIYLVIATQLSGQPNFIYYAKAIIPNHSDSTVILFGLVKFLSTFICTFTVDKIGRKFLLNLGCLIMFISLLSINFVDVSSDNKIKSSLTNSSATLTNSTFFLKNIKISENYLKFSFSFYALGFSISFGPLLWVLLTEIFPKDWTETLFGYCMSINSIVNFIISNFFLESKEIFGIGILLNFHAFCCLSFILINYFIIPNNIDRDHNYSTLNNPKSENESEIALL